MTISPNPALTSKTRYLYGILDETTSYKFRRLLERPRLTDGLFRLGKGYLPGQKSIRHPN